MPTNEELKPHHYHPSTMHMGDCSVCGNVASSPIHDVARLRPADAGWWRIDMMLEIIERARLYVWHRTDETADDDPARKAFGEMRSLLSYEDWTLPASFEELCSKLRTIVADAGEVSYQELHLYEGDSALVIRENGNKTLHGVQLPELLALFDPASEVGETGGLSAGFIDDGSLESRAVRAAVTEWATPAAETGGLVERRATTPDVPLSTLEYYMSEAENGWCKIPRRVVDDAVQSFAFRATSLAAARAERDALYRRSEQAMANSAEWNAAYQEAAAELAAADTPVAWRSRMKLSNGIDTWQFATIRWALPDDAEPLFTAAAAKVCTAADMGGLVERLRLVDHYDTRYSLCDEAAEALAAAREQIAELERDGWKRLFDGVLTENADNVDALSSARETIRELKFALFASDMTIKDRADQSARLFLERAVLTLARETPDGQ